MFFFFSQATFIVLVTASLLVTSKQYIGDPIDCMVEEIPQNVMDTYCWIHSTYSVSDKVRKKRLIYGLYICYLTET